MFFISRLTSELSFVLTFLRQNQTPCTCKILGSIGIRQIENLHQDDQTVAY